MRRHHALLLAAGLATAPASVVAGPGTRSGTSPGASPSAPTVQRFEWSMVSAKGRLGVMVLGVTPELRQHFGAKGDRGVLVGRVEPSSAAASAGVSVGDLIVEVRGTPIDSATDVLSAMAGLKKGDVVDVTVIRDRQRRPLQATLTEDVSSSFGGFEPGFRGFEQFPGLEQFPGPDWFRELFERPFGELGPRSPATPSSPPTTST